MLLRLTSDCQSAASSFLPLRLQVCVSLCLAPRINPTLKIKTDSKGNRWGKPEFGVSGKVNFRDSGQGQRGTLHVRKGQLIQETIRALNACTPDLVLGERSDASAIDGEPASWHT